MCKYLSTLRQKLHKTARSGTRYPCTSPHLSHHHCVCPPFNETKFLPGLNPAVGAVYLRLQTMGAWYQGCACMWARCGSDCAQQHAVAHGSHAPLRIYLTTITFVHLSAKRISCWVEACCRGSACGCNVLAGANNSERTSVWSPTANASTFCSRLLCRWRRWRCGRWKFFWFKSIY